MDQQTQNSKFNAIALFFLELIKISLITGITIVAVRYFLFKPFYVEGASMEPNFKEHEYLIIDELTYRLRSPKRGETIVFRFPLNTKVHYLKRIIALPGERIKIADGKTIVFNKEFPQGFVVNEEFLGDETTVGQADVTLEDDEYFLMGDNRDNSYDSRRFGPVKKSLIVGRVVLRGWPLERFGVIKSAP